MNTLYYGDNLAVYNVLFAEPASLRAQVLGWAVGGFPRVQLLTVAQLLGGAAIQMPSRERADYTFKKAPKAADVRQRLSLLDAPGADD